jgi:serine protease AprX
MPSRMAWPVGQGAYFCYNFITMDRRFLNVGLAVGIASLLLAGLALWAGPVPQAVVAAPPAHIAPQVWQATAGGGEAEFLVILAEQADLGAATSAPTREARLRRVYDALREVAVRTQAPIRAELDGAGVSYRPFYVVNMLAVKGDRALVTRLAARPEVARIAANPRVRQLLPEPQPGGVGPLVSQGIEWNVAHVNADDVWALGYTGQGIVVAGQDTGYDWDHPALVNQYRGYNGVTATHDYNWHDAIHTNDPHTPAGNPCGFDSPVPCDDQDHGTHTMGIIVGDDGAGNRIGVAPGARWIGCRNMEEGWGTPATYAECFEFFLAPYPLGGDPFADGVPGLAPHVINNSWTCPPSEGCDWDALQAVVENVRAAGIVVVASAGNSGSSCSTIGDPPAIYDAAFSVGASDSSDGIASFSSRGPVTVDGSGRLKPDVVAPGVGVRSSVPGGWYGLKSGTSMAGPHVAGTVALLWSAAPGLVGDVDGTERIIARTARPRVDTTCDGDPGGRPNNVYGWGIVDALAAVRGTQFELEIGKRAAFPMSFPSRLGPGPRLLVYTLSVTNTSYLTLTRIVLTDTVPVSTSFAWASGNYTQAGWDPVHGGVVTWTAASLAGQESLTATLAVTVEHLPPGTRVVNAGYGARADELVTPVAGVPVEVVVPWRYFMFPVFVSWPLEGNADG